MGTSKRYAASIDRQMNERAAQSIMRDGAPATLTDSELELHMQPLTKTPKPEPVRAWVRYGSTPLKVDAFVVGWTPRAVALTWEAPDGETHRCWVWASAVERQ